MEVWNGWPEGERLSVVDLEGEASESATAIKAAEAASKSTAKQMLAKFGVEANLRVIFIPDAMTHEEIAAEVEQAHATEEAGGQLPTTN
jgi:hypothetical protein